jgi:hypothetical protein
VALGRRAPPPDGRLGRAQQSGAYPEVVEDLRPSTTASAPALSVSSG